MSVQFLQKSIIPIFWSEKEPEAVKIAIHNLQMDLKKVLQAEGIAAGANNARIFIATLQGTKELNKAEESENIERKLGSHLNILKDEAGYYRKEAYLILEEQGVLYLLGTDRRGTIYAIYEFCEWMGVSPWYFWADVPVKKKSVIQISDGYRTSDYPSVEYRGIFINDEEELNHWVQLHMDEDTIGVKTYEKVFELLLRLKGNYIWPAMHVNSFNMKPENGALAERMGIVVGTSHCDMLMRSNHREWKPWIEKKGYHDAIYDYSIPGRNREILKEYWKESVEQNKEFEVSYTLGMRGIHDSGFQTKALEGKSGDELIQAKGELLQEVIQTQTGILDDVLGHDTMKTFVPYKEVLNLYDHGLKVPEDLTLIWTNDNYGYVRRYPDENEKKRKGGNGIYYHNSYWAPPGGSYLFICSIPLAHTRNELKKAYEEGIRKLWVMNVGAMKPLEQEMEYYLRLAWEIGKEGALTEDVDRYLEDWLNRNFSWSYGNEMAVILNEFSQLTNVRKIEQMDNDAFSQTAYGDEAATRMNRYKELFDRANLVYEAVQEEEKDAFFELCLMKIHAAYYTNAMYYYGDRSTLCVNQGKMQAAAYYTRLCREFDDARRKLLIYYGDIMAGGKWNGMVTPEDFPPPRTAMFPACTPPLSIGKRQMLIETWNDEPELFFVRPGEKWFEIANAGEGTFEFEITAPDWVKLSETVGTVTTEKRIMVSIENISQNLEGQILIRNLSDNQSVTIKVLVHKEKTECVNIEDGGILTVEADKAEGLEDNKVFYSIKRLGRQEGNLVEANPVETVQLETDSIKEGRLSGTDILSYPVYLTSSGTFLLEIHRFPSLDSTGRIRIGISVDGGEVQIVESESNDEWRGNWKYNTRNNVDKLYLKLPELQNGEHRIEFHAIDRYFAFSRFVIYTRPRKENSLAILSGNQRLPEKWNLDEVLEQFYGAIELPPRPVIYAPLQAPSDTTIPADRITQPVEYGRQITPEQILLMGDNMFTEDHGVIKIDAACVLAQSAYAYYTNYEWQYCSSESYHRSGLAMYIRKPGLSFKANREAPSLQYRLKCQGGSYTVWILMKFNSIEDSNMTIGFDGQMELPENIYQGRRIWRYSAEQVWRWVPVYQTNLSAGEHLLGIYCLASGIRFDRIYITKGEELPSTDEMWENKREN